jgi:hypothetical protein
MWNGWETLGGKMKSFNVNCTVKVLLTEHGKQLLERDHNQFWGSRGMLDKFPYVPYKPDADGYVKFQLWTLMDKLGKYCGLGSEMPFDTVILIDEKDLRGGE